MSRYVSSTPWLTLRSTSTLRHLTPALIHSIFASPPEPVTEAYPYHAQYSSILCCSFPAVQFSTSWVWLDHNLNALIVHLKTTRTTEKPVFIVLIVAPYSSATSKDVEVTMLKLLKEADRHESINVLHGVCLSGTRASFYQYDREQKMISPRPRGHANFALDLAQEDGAVHYVEVAEDIKRMCREIISDLHSPGYMDIPDPSSESQSPYY